MAATAPAANSAEAADRSSGRNLFSISEKHVKAFQNLSRIYSYATVLDKVVLVISCVASIAAGLAMPLINILFGNLVGAFTSFFKQGTGETVDEFTTAIDRCVLYIVYVFIGKLCLSYISNLGFRVVSMRISATIRLVYLRSLLSLPISTLDMIPAGQTAAIITSTASTLQLGISERLGELLSSLSAAIAAIVIALGHSWLLTLGTSLGLVVIALIYCITSPPIAKIMAELLEGNIKFSSAAAESFTSVRMVAACGAESKMMGRFTSLVDETKKAGVRMARLVAAQQGLIMFSVYGLLCIMIMATSIAQISTPLTGALQAADACAIFHTIIDAPKPVYGTASGADVSVDGDIVFENVNFSYATRPDVKILDCLNLQIPAGKVTAIVGSSGSGKSTIVGILQRWYEFNGDMETNQFVLWLRNGLITVGGRKLSEIDVKWWRNQIGLVQQDNALFDTTIYKNVEYGLIGTKWEHAHEGIKDRLVRKACRDAFADEFIDRLPNGYFTVVGEHGMKLSGGQRQRLAIARAIVKQPKILILDEATSAIDVRSEQILQAALDRACRGRTTIVIAHRLGTIKKADKIVVLRKGHIIQEGTHAELMGQTYGAYHLLATAQDLDMSGRESDASPAWSDDTDISTVDIAASSQQGDEFLDEKHLVFRQSESRQSSEDGYFASLVDELEDMESEDEGLIRVLELPKHRFGGFVELLKEQRSRWRMYICILVAALGVGSSNPLQAYLFSELVSLFSLWGPNLIEAVNFWCLMFFFLAVGVGCSYWILAWSTTTFGFAVMRKYRKEYFGNIIAKPASFFDQDDNSAGALTARLATDPQELQQLLGTNMTFFLMSLFNLIGCISISLFFGWKLTLVALCSSMPIVILAMLYRVRYEMQFDAMSNAVFAESARFASESITAIRTVSSLTMENEICLRYETLLVDHVGRASRKAWSSVFLFSFCDSVSLLSMAFVLWYGSRLLASHEYTQFQYMVVYIAVVQGGLSAGRWLSYGSNIAKATVAADRILATRDDDQDFNHSTATASHDVHDEKGVELVFNDVWFEYPTRPVPVLKGLSMKINKGSFAAIVGPSGSGKSTAIALLERYYAANSGEILRDGIEISNINLGQYRSGISLVAQEPNLFSGSVRDNILLGVQDESFVPLTTLHRAAQDSGIHDFIMSLPEGYDTHLGRNGVALSGGQKQRISIARALIRMPSLLLLDEATSSLDSETEREVQAVFDATKGTRTMVVVAHRLATVQNADVIFVMEDGRVVEQGDHISLIKRRGTYFRMCQSQALNR
ncbi:ABC transporter [Xylariales sp. PMI_506]|nr:ABC transporter [Xylariales sp. PMI_506]